MSEALIRCEWDGEAFVPSSPFQARIADQEFGEGEVVLISVEGERSAASHRHEFASIRDMWATLPESLAEMPYAKSPETLRKHALVATGFSDVETIDAGGKAAAERIAAYVGGLATKAHGYAIVKVGGSVVRVWTPRSQSYRAMGKDEFHRSKSAVLAWIEGLLEGEREDAA